MSKNTAKTNNSKHPLLHHKINFSHAMHLATGVSSLYLLGIFFALIGFISGYTAGLTTTNTSNVNSYQNTTAEDLDIFVQDILDEQMVDELDQDAMGLSTQAEELELDTYAPVDGEVINTPPLDIQVSEPTTMTVDDSVIVSAPSYQSDSASASVPEDLASYGLIISMGGLVFGMNLMHEDDKSPKKSGKKVKKVSSIK